MLATLRNMRMLEDSNQKSNQESGIIAYSWNTRQQSSASSGDYWLSDPNEALLDQEGNPMILVKIYHHPTILPLDKTGHPVPWNAFDPEDV